MKSHRIKDELESIARSSVPEDINLWPNISARLERKSQMFTPRTRPLMAIVLAIFTLLVLSGAAYALGRTLGYLPDYGLVDSTSGLRILTEPVSVTRDGVTLTVTQVLVYPDHVQLVYEVNGIAPENNSATFNAEQRNAMDEAAFCGGSTTMPFTDNDARLRLPDGTMVNRVFNMEKYPQNVYAQKPTFETVIPADATGLTLVLRCIPWMRLGAVPEDWEVPFYLEPVPAGTVVGAPVVEVQPTAVQPVEKPTAQEDASPAAIPVRPVTMTLTHIVPLDSATVVYFSMDMENKDPSLVSIMPLGVYVIDSQGQKTRMRGNYVWQPFDHRVGSEFEFVTQSKPALGSLTIVVEKAVAYYAPGHVDPPQAKPSELEFTFDAGENPQVGQIWALNNTIEIAGYPLRVTSAQATTYTEVKSQNPDFYDSQGYEFGYDFTVENDPSVKIQVEMDIMSESPTCGLSNSNPFAPYTASLHYIQLCREKFPTGNVKVQIWQLAVLMENTWQATWQP